MNAPDPHLPVTLATYVFLVRSAGHPVHDPAVEAACAAFGAQDRAPEELGAALVDAVRARLGGDTVADLVKALGALFGDVPARSDLGAAPDREARAAAIRRAHFGNHLPWLALIADRMGDGTVGTRWVLVESFDAVAKVMDPNPWDEKDEERELPIEDFLVRWELAGCPSVRVG